MNSKQGTRQSTSFLSSYIPNQKERHLTFISLLATVCFLLIGFLFIWFNKQTLMAQEHEAYEEIIEQLGSISRMIYFAVLAVYPVFLLLKWKRLHTMQWRNIKLKNILVFLGKTLRKWHVPLALVSTGVILLHGYLAIIRGFKWDFTNLTGVAAFILLGFLLFMGFKRFKRQDKKWHFKLALAFLILFMIHSSL